jgi:hypothetical protein
MHFGISPAGLPIQLDGCPMTGPNDRPTLRIEGVGAPTSGSANRCVSSVFTDARSNTRYKSAVTKLIHAVFWIHGAPSSLLLSVDQRRRTRSTLGQEYLRAHVATGVG